MELESEEDLKIAVKKDRDTMGHRYVEGMMLNGNSFSIWTDVLDICAVTHLLFFSIQIEQCGNGLGYEAHWSELSGDGGGWIGQTARTSFWM